MLFLADEDFPGIAVHWLREAGHDVLWARTNMPGEADSVLLAAAQKDSRVVLTCDKDFGELAFHWGLPASCGVVLFRFTASSPEVFLQRFKDLMEAETEIGFSGKFCVVEADRVRSRPLDRIS
jgi:predicted nuclease of predicted toxin-antitoxin system